MSVEHYENFPVASVLLPRRLRGPVQAIYAFARSADDLADEGDANPQQRLAALARYGEELDRIEAGLPPVHAETAPLFRALAPVLRDWRIPLALPRALLSAFRQDVVQRRHADFASLLDYCKRSADPVGRIMLCLFGVDDAQSLRESDAVCSALQLVNFWQDVAVDWQKGRVYLPQEDLARFGVDERQIAEGRVDANWRALMRFEVERARALMLSGAPLARRMPGRFGWELRLVVLGGLRILEKIEAVDYDVFRRRPTIGKLDALRMLWRAPRFVG